MSHAADQSSQPETKQTAERAWTTRDLLEWMTPYFQQRGVESPRLVAEILLGQVLGCERLRLYMEVDRPASRDELATLRSMVTRIGRHEPVQYVMGSWSFRGRAFKVGPDVLIPRPSTECVVERALTLLKASEGGAGSQLIADIGTGSGVIAVCMALESPGVRVVASDVSQAALDMARINAAALGLTGSIEFRSGSHYEPLGAEERFDLIIANPPYISDEEWEAVPKNVRDYEPTIALRGGADGLDHLRPLIATAHEHLKPGGFLVFEIAASQAEAVLDLALENRALADPRVEPDHEDLPRILIAQRAADQ